MIKDGAIEIITGQTKKHIFQQDKGLHIYKRHGVQVVSVRYGFLIFFLSCFPGCGWRSVMICFILSFLLGKSTRWTPAVFGIFLFFRWNFSSFLELAGCPPVPAQNARWISPAADSAELWTFFFLSFSRSYTAGTRLLHSRHDVDLFITWGEKKSLVPAFISVVPPLFSRNKQNPPAHSQKENVYCKISPKKFSLYII